MLKSASIAVIRTLLKEQPLKRNIVLTKHATAPQTAEWEETLALHISVGQTNWGYDNKDCSHLRYIGTRSTQLQPGSSLRAMNALKIWGLICSNVLLQHNHVQIVPVMILQLEKLAQAAILPIWSSIAEALSRHGLLGGKAQPHHQVCSCEQAGNPVWPAYCPRIWNPPNRKD